MDPAEKALIMKPIKDPLILNSLFTTRKELKLGNDDLVADVLGDTNGPKYSSRPPYKYKFKILSDKIVTTESYVPTDEMFSNVQSP